MPANKSFDHKTHYLLNFLFAFIAFWAAWFIFSKVVPPKPVEAPANQMVFAQYKCSNGKTINATFVNNGGDYVNLALSDGRQIYIPHGLSADGARYVNWDGSFVFWSRGETAFVQEGNVNTYDNCTQESSKQ